MSFIHSSFLRRAGFLLLLTVTGCASLWTTRPSQEMSNMEVSIRAAKEVSADTLAPELYRLASENALSARREYRLKNFKEAKEYAEKARLIAERSEFESIRNGGKREAVPQDPLADPSYQPEAISPQAGGGAASPPKAGSSPPPPPPSSP